MSAEAGLGSDRRVLYRCPNRTNFLCPCGAVARRLRRHGLEYRTERVPYRLDSVTKPLRLLFRGDRHRAEIVELTRQKRVPVLVDGEEVIHDSKRINQYLDWKYG